MPAGSERLPSAIEVDLARSRRGLRSLLAEDLAGKPLLTRTIEQLRRARRIDPPVLLVREEEAPALRDLLAGLAVEIFPHRFPDIPARPRLRRARRWSGEGWRGGVAGTYFASEAGNPAALAALCRARKFAAAVTIPAEAALVDPGLVDEMVDSYVSREPRQIYLSTAAPGLAADIYYLEALDHFAKKGAGAHDLLPFRFGEGVIPYENMHVYHLFSPEVTQLRGRLLADSRAGFAQLRSFHQDLQEVHATATTSAWIQWAREHPDTVAGATPEEIILDLGTGAGGFAPRDPRPAGTASPPPVLENVWGKLLAAFALRDDALLTFAGDRSDPLLDPRLEARTREARAAGVFGIHVETSAATLDRARAEALLAAPIDIISVALHAADAESSSALPARSPALADRLRGLEHLLAAREARAAKADLPFVVVAISLENATARSWETFFEGWHGRTDGIVVRSPESETGATGSEALGAFHPPERFPCLRLTRQMRVEPSGIVPLCNRDPNVKVRAGSLLEQSAAEIWQGSVFRAARRAHQHKQWESHHHCGPCASWCRLD